LAVHSAVLAPVHRVVRGPGPAWVLVATALASASCTGGSPVCQNYARRDFSEELGTASGTASLTWPDHTTAAYTVHLGGDLKPGECQLTVTSIEAGPVGGSAHSPPIPTTYITCSDVSSGRTWDLLFQGWQLLSDARPGGVFHDTRPAFFRFQPLEATQRCDDDQTPSSVTLTVLESVGAFSFSDASVSADYLRRLDLQVTFGPSRCGLESGSISVVVEQGPEQLKFRDSTERACPE
jgi:hypothetical protein